MHHLSWVNQLFPLGHFPVRKLKSSLPEGIIHYIPKQNPEKKPSYVSHYQRVPSPVLDIGTVGKDQRAAASPGDVLGPIGSDRREDVTESFRTPVTNSWRGPFF
jgi:hypothetical protein